MTSRPRLRYDNSRCLTNHICARDLRPQFRLRTGRDDELIEWLTALAPRQRSAAIRRALSQHLAARKSAGGGRWQENPKLAAALDSLF